MRSVFLLLLFITITSCENLDHKSSKVMINKFPIKENRRKTPFYLENQFSGIYEYNTNLAINSDSIFIAIERSSNLSENPKVKKGGIFIIERHWWTRGSKNSKVLSAMEVDSFQNGRSIISQMKKMAVYFENIVLPGISYVNPPNNIYQILEKKKVVSKTTRFQKFQQAYYFTDFIDNGKFYIYHSDSDSLQTLTYNDREAFFKIKNFFLYDFTGDGQPEIFIFSVGDRSGDWISIDVYSIKEQS